MPIIMNSILPPSGGGGNNDMEVFLNGQLSILSGNYSYVGRDTFCENSILREINLPNCTSVYGTFYSCSNLSVINLPNCENISNAFYNCAKITQLSLPNLREIHHGNIAYRYTISNCGSLTSLYFPKLKSIYGGIGYCNKLSSIYAPELEYITGNSTFVGSFATLSYLDFPNLQTIYYTGSSVFYYMTGLERISFPNIKSIYTNTNYTCFNNCSKLSSIYMPQCSIIKAFYSCPSVTTLNFPECISFYGITGGTSSKQNGVTTINLPKCEDFGGLTWCPISTFELPKCTTFRGGQYCNNLTSVSLPMVDIFSGVAFNSCAALTSASYSTCTLISGAAFAQCASLTMLSFDNLKSICSTAITSCPRLISLYLLGSTVVSISASTFNSTPLKNYSTVAGQWGSIFVPASLYTAYCTANRWSTISARIVSV